MWTLPLGWVTIAVNRPTGIYQTPADFQAKVGDSYTLMITLPNGDQYTSLAQSIQPVANIQDVSIHTYVRPTQNPILDASGVQFRVTLSDPAGQNNYYLWRFSDPVYEFVSNPELWNASGQIRGHPLFDHPPTCCRVCYRFDDTDITRTFNISDDGLYDGLTTTLAAHEIPDDGWRFKSRFRVRFNQYSIPEDGYRFLRLVQQQLQIEGSVFDPPPANIRGNMISLDNPDRQVLGYFFACDVSSREIYITPDDLTFRQTPGLFPDDCREAKGFSTRLNTIPPPDWKWD